MAWMDSLDAIQRREDDSKQQRVIVVSSQHPQEAAQTTSVSSLDSAVIVDPSQVQVEHR
jgi:hypothetical protein